MAISRSKRINMILRLIGSNAINSIEEFIQKINSREFLAFVSENQLEDNFKEYMRTFNSSHSLQAIESIRYYTGYAFNDINSILRNTWSYEKNGLLTDQKRKEIMEIISAVEQVMSTLPVLEKDIKVYRGVSLNCFKDYGINSIQDLINLKGEFYFESGFTSTSLLRDKSFFDRELDWHEKCNIEIEYLVSKECNDGLPLLSDELSYSKIQSEYLINKGSLFKIIDVSISEDQTKAYLKMILLPQKIWNLSYNQEVSPIKK